MTRRTATLTTSAVVLVVLVCVAFLLPVPYVTMRPGPTQDVLPTKGGKPIVEIERPPHVPDRRVAGADHGVGDLGRTGHRAGGGVPGLVLARGRAGAARRHLPPRADRAGGRGGVGDPDGRLAGGRRGGRAAAARRPTSGRSTRWATVDPGSPADGELEEGDVIVAVDGQPVRQLERGPAARSVTREPGDDVVVTVRRDDGAGRRDDDDHRPARTTPTRRSWASASRSTTTCRSR